MWDVSRAKRDKRHGGKQAAARRLLDGMQTLRPLGGLWRQEGLLWVAAKELETIKSN